MFVKISDDFEMLHIQHAADSCACFRTLPAMIMSALIIPNVGEVCC